MKKKWTTARVPSKESKQRHESHLFHASLCGRPFVGRSTRTSYPSTWTCKHSLDRTEESPQLSEGPACMKSKRELIKRRLLKLWLKRARKPERGLLAGFCFGISRVCVTFIRGLKSSPPPSQPTHGSCFSKDTAKSILSLGYNCFRSTNKQTEFTKIHK